MNLRKLSAILLLVTGITANAYDFSAKTNSDITLYYSVNPDGKSVAVAPGPEKYNCSNLEIPAQVTNNGTTYNVTKIGANAFERATINMVILPNGIDEILPNAFSYSEIPSISFPASLKHIRQQAFVRSSIGSAIFQEGLLTIDNNVFNECHKLTEISLPSTLTNIGNGCFFRSAIRTVEIPDLIETIPENAFTQCSSLVTVKFGKSVKSIASAAFKEAAIEVLNMPAGLESIGYEAFKMRSVKEINLNEGLRAIGIEAFAGCSATDIIIPNSVTEISNGAFSANAQLETIKFPVSMKSLPEKVCYGCSNLHKVEFPADLETLGGYAFYGCERLSSIKLPDTFVSFAGNSIFCGTGITTFAFPPKVTILSSGLFSNCKNLTAIVIPDYINTLESNIFSGCSSLMNVTLPKNLVTINEYTFAECNALENIKLPATLKSIKDHAFQKSGLKSLDLPEGLESVGRDVFYDCPYLQEIRFPNSVSSLGYAIFSGCKALETVYLPAGITYIYPMFQSTTNLKSVYCPIAIPPTVSTVGLTVFPVIDEENAATLYVPRQSVDDYSSNEHWKTFNKIEGYDFENLVFSVTVNVENGSGIIKVNGNESYMTRVPEGETAEIEFIPDAGWTLEKATVNGKEISVKDNRYMIENVNTNLTVSAIFSRVPVSIEIKSSEAGSICVPSEWGKSTTLTIVPEEGWSINTVTFDFMDVTGQLVDGTYETPKLTQEKYTLNVSFEKDNIGAISSTLNGNSIKVYSVGHTLYMEGLMRNEPYSIYTTDGTLIATGISNGETQRMSLSTSGVLIIKCNTKTFKVLID